MAVMPDFTPGRLSETGSQTDLAIAGEGFFVTRGGEATLYTRQGQFERDAEGRLTTGSGLVLQAEGGGDLIVPAGEFTVAADGTVTAGGAPIARIALVRFELPALLRAGAAGGFSAGEAEPIALASPSVRQGMLEMSNVNTGDEMVAMMEALRRAETGQRLVTTYDELMGRALSLFGQQP
jgi:flagellar basal body rod protein FlgG